MRKELIPFNKPYFTGKETTYIEQAVASGHVSGNGNFTRKCQDHFTNRWGFKKCLLTTSCTDALEMAAMLLDIKSGDEIIMPSFTFVSTALAFVRQGAKIIFVDSCPHNPNIDANKIEALITPRSKAIVVVHYAGIACDMKKISAIAQKHNLFVVEDAAQAIDSYYYNQPLGSIGHLACFSFHETKNIQCGEGGLLAINDDRFIERAEIIWEKGTNRASFFRGEIDKYGWVDIGSSFLPSDLLAAFLYAQIENLNEIQQKRKKIWEFYNENLKILENQHKMKLPKIDAYSTNNGHMFYIICRNIDERGALIQYMKKKNVMTVFHYQSLHKSPFYKKYSGKVNLSFSDEYEDCLLRLPLYYELSGQDISYVVENILSFYK